MTLYTWSALKKKGGETNLNVTIFRDTHIFTQDRELRKNLLIRILIYFIYIYIYTRHIYTDFRWTKRDIKRVRSRVIQSNGWPTTEDVSSTIYIEYFISTLLLWFYYYYYYYYVNRPDMGWEPVCMDWD